GIKAERGSMPKRTCSFALVASAMSLASVFNNDQPMLLSQSHNRLHVGWMTVKVHRDDGLRTRSNSFLDYRDVNRVGISIDVDEHRSCSSMRNRQCGSNKTVRRGDDLIARSDLVRAKSQLESRC